MLVSKTTVLLLLLSLAATPGRTQEVPSLYLVDSQFGDLQTRIFRVDTASGALELRADLGTAFTPVLGMAAAGRNIFYLAGTDTGPGNLCQGNVACLLLRVEMDPLSPTPVLVQVIGTMTENGAMRAGITGLTFRQDGNLYAISQDTSGLYLLDPATAVLTRIGTVDIEIHGGDITFDGSDRLWLWTNIGAGDGLYQVDPVSAHATLLDLEPFLDMAGLAAVGHGNTLQGASPIDDHLYEMDPVTGLTGTSVQLTLGGTSFDHRRGDMDSPFCEEDAACDDDNVCTSDDCSPGGCRHPAVPNGTGCDDGNACTQVDACQSGSCAGSSPVICTAPDGCHEPGTCNPATGACENAPAKPDGTACDDGNACTLADACLSGTCVPGPLPDGDLDGYPAAYCGGSDCDDSLASVFPGAPQICDGLNNDCLFPGWPSLAGTNETDDDGDTLAECLGDCDDAVAATYPDAPETNDALDNQCPSNFGYGSIDEISGLSGFTIAGDPTQFCWTSQALATEYEVVRSADLSFPKPCAGAYQPAACWSDAAIPPVGAVYFYLVRANSPHKGSWGKESSGTERTGLCPSGPQ